MPDNVVLAITGSIAAFKGAALASELVKRGHEVRPILTAGATRFVTPLTLEGLTAQSAAVELWDEQPGSSRMGHLELARWADVLAVAPASAGAIARLALGLTGDLLGAVALACPAPLLIAPAMESTMYRHPATQQHLKTLRSRGTIIVGPEIGHLASGTSGEGRMSEPAAIADAIDGVLRHQIDLRGCRVLVTAGPTVESLDPVRYIGNRSSGKMGYAIAEEARARGAEVVLVSGPTALPPPPVETIGVESTDEMRRAVLERASGMDVVVMAAAVADFKPARVESGKRKRRGAFTLELEPTPDIAAELSQVVPDAIHVGFALETEDLLTSARSKLARKGQDLVVANVLSAEHNPFGADTNHVYLVTREETVELPEMPKRQVASVIWDTVRKLLDVRRSEPRRTVT